MSIYSSAMSLMDPLRITVPFALSSCAEAVLLILQTQDDLLAHLGSIQEAVARRPVEVTRLSSEGERLLLAQALEDCHERSLPRDMKTWQNIPYSIEAVVARHQLHKETLALAYFAVTLNHLCVKNGINRHFDLFPLWYLYPEKGLGKEERSENRHSRAEITELGKVFLLNRVRWATEAEVEGLAATMASYLIMFNKSLG